MRQFSEELYNLFAEWEPEKLSIAAEGYIVATSNDDDANERVFRNSSNACVAVYVPIVDLSQIAIRSDWLSEYVGDEVGKVYDSFSSELSDDYSQLKKI